jgi:hypothetical protein
MPLFVQDRIVDTGEFDGKIDEEWTTSFRSWKEVVWKIVHHIIVILVI